MIKASLLKSSELPDDISAFLVYDGYAAIPDGSGLSVEEILPDSEWMSEQVQYANYLESARQELDLQEMGDWSLGQADVSAHSSPHKEPLLTVIGQGRLHLLDGHVLHG